MFETAILSNGPSTKRVWATCAGFAGQLVLIGCALLVPLLWPQVIPRVASFVSIAPPGPPPPPPPLGDPAPKRPRVVPFQSNGHAFTEPVHVPEHPLIFVEAPEVPTVAGDWKGRIGGVPGGMDNGVPGGILPTAPQSTATPKTSEAVAQPKTRQIATVAPPDKPGRVSQVQLATPIFKVEPAYPILARQAGISGTVDLMGVLGVDGRIHELRVLHGHPLLIKAAMDAVKQWIFAPTLLNGEPVEVQAPIQVNFILKR